RCVSGERHQGRECRSSLSGHPLPATHRQPTRNWRSRINTVLDALRRKQDPDCLFWAGCRMAEVMIDTKKPKLKGAQALLEDSCPNLRRAIGVDEVRRVIINAFHHVEKDELERSTKLENWHEPE